LPYADIVIGNEDEAAAFAEKSKWKKDDLQATALLLAALPKEGKKERIVIFTHGAQPTIIAHAGVVTLVPVKLLDKSLIVDTNGAGDAFVGGLLAGLSLGHPITKAVNAGQYAACEVIQQDGAKYPDNCSYDWYAEL